jgi:hypothetical protein
MGEGGLGNETERSPPLPNKGSKQNEGGIEKWGRCLGNS